ncbi:MAG: peptidyl-prolyl cis-trans isomerase [Rickettsiales bacterium]|jgi:hypothetical protein|nr:peptidyl-prolyl cis-trans isomerase [Rickettsiales bacterium]
MTALRSIKKTKKNASKYLLGAFVVIFVLYSLSGIVFVMSNKYNIIEGEGKKLHLNEFFSMRNAKVQNSYHPNMTARQIVYINSKDFMVSFLNELVNSKLLELELENFALKNPDELILKSISEEKSFQGKEGFDFAKFEAFLEKEGITELGLMEKVGLEESKKFLLGVLGQTPLVNEAAMEILLAENNIGKNVKIFSIERSIFKKNAVTVTEDEIKRYYEQNIQKFVTPETRKIDYVKIANYKAAQFKKMREAVNPRANIRTVAKTMKAKIESLGYFSESDLLDNDKNFRLAGVINMKLDGLSNVLKVGNDIYVYSVTDIKNGSVRSLEEVREVIAATIRAEKILELQKNIVANHLEKYKKGNFNDQILLDLGFSLKRINNLGERNKFSYEKDFVQQIINTGDGKFTEIFHDDKKMYLALITASKTISETDENYFSRAQLLEKFKKQTHSTILKYYLSYLRTRKYSKMKVNYGLLNLIM